MSTRSLTPTEARVLAVLVEKQHTVPDSYPLSLNALTLGCNQKTAREPVKKRVKEKKNKKKKEENRLITRTIE